MYDIREELMNKMVTALRAEQTHFEIMSDEEFYNSDYGIRRRQRGQKCSSVVYMHCLVPGSARNLLGVYFHKKDICVAAPMAFSIYDPDVNVDRAQKGVFKQPYLEFRVIRKDHDEMYEDTKKLIKDMLNYAEKHHLY